MDTSGTIRWRSDNTATLSYDQLNAVYNEQRSTWGQSCYASFAAEPEPDAQPEPTPLEKRIKARRNWKHDSRVQVRQLPSRACGMAKFQKWAMRQRY